MQLTAMYLSLLDREVERTKRALLQVPEEHDDWKPHEKSMPLGQLVGMVAAIPTWFVLILTSDDLDLAPATPKHKPEPLRTQKEWLAALDKGATAARDALSATNEAFLETNWTLKAHGKAVQVIARGDMIADTFAHWAHHRGQVTVYLRLLGATVPALYGPSADDPRYT